jgi:predicted RNA-binding protein associated with RNAse of E/G family
MSGPVTVIKTDYAGREVWRYEGTAIEQDDSHIKLEAYFNRPDLDLGYVIFRRGDRFVEFFYTNRWYNIFEVHDIEDGHIKGWYCNFARPARIGGGLVQADDLALDLFVYPDGRMLILDEEEFEGLPINQAEKEKVREALASLQEMVREGKPPFTRQ